MSTAATATDARTSIRTWTLTFDEFAHRLHCFPGTQILSMRVERGTDGSPSTLHWRRRHPVPVPWEPNGEKDFTATYEELARLLCVPLWVVVSVVVDEAGRTVTVRMRLRETGG